MDMTQEMSKEQWSKWLNEVEMGFDARIQKEESKSRIIKLKTSKKTQNKISKSISVYVYFKPKSKFLYPKVTINSF